MLRVFVYLSGRRESVEVTVRPAGQQLGGFQQGRKAHFWWTYEELEKNDPDAARVLRCLVPGLDRVWVGRDLPDQAQVQQVFDGAVVECGFDPQMVSLTAVEAPRQAYPPQPPPSGVREPVQPPVTPQPPEGAVPPSAEVTHQQRGNGDFFMQARQGHAPVPMGSDQVT